MWYTIAMNFAWAILVHFHYADKPEDMEWYWFFLILIVTFFGGEYLITKHDKWLWKRKVMKVARKVAEYQGLDPDTLDFKDFDVVETEDGIIEIIIYKKQGEDDK
jgi:hypothetical protein